MTPERISRRDKTWQPLHVILFVFFRVASVLTFLHHADGLVSVRSFECGQIETEAIIFRPLLTTPDHFQRIHIETGNNLEHNSDGASIVLDYLPKASASDQRAYRMNSNPR